MKLSECEKCPKCGRKGTVFCGHDCSDNSYTIHCYTCGLSTDKYDTYKKAHKAWDELKKEQQGENTDGSNNN